MDGLHVVLVGDCNALRTACVEDLEVSGGWVAVARDDAALQRRLVASSQRLDAAIVDARDATDPVSPSLALLRVHSPGAVMVVLSPQPDAVDDLVSDAIVIGPPHDTLRVLSAARKGTGRGDERRKHAEVVTALQQVLSATGFRALTRQHRRGGRRWLDGPGNVPVAPALRRAVVAAVLAGSLACVDRDIGDGGEAASGNTTGTVGGSAETGGTPSSTNASAAEGPTAGTGNGPGCEDGSPGEGCPCAPDGYCAPSFECNTVLSVCISSTCHGGNEACVCGPTGLCKPDLTCVDNFCTDLECPTGSAGCDCIPLASCNAGLECVGAVCSLSASGSD